MDRLVRFARWLATQPAAVLVLGALVLAIAFPATPLGTLGRLILYGALGVAVAWWWPSLPAAIRTPSPRTATFLALASVGAFGLAMFWPAIASSPSPEWLTGDWGPQHAVLARIMPDLPGFDVPTWNHAVSTGDAPLELYPALTYLVTGHLALVLGLEHDLPHAFMIVATLVHLALALTTVLVAMRVASRPIAVVLGVFFLADSGAISHGGTVGLFHWALLHSAFAHAFSMIAAVAILSALRRPRLGASVAIWIATAISTAAHPAALITATTFAIALVAVALLAADVMPRRALAALGHLAIGVALGAVVWLPASERLIAYGQHFPNELFSDVRLLQIVMQFAMPITSYSLLVYSGYLGIVTGMWTRRAEVVFIAVVGLVMLLGLADSAYLSLGLAESKAVARLGAVRMMMLVRPFVFAAAAFAIGALVAHARHAWRGATPTRRWIAAAVVGVMLGSFARVIPEYWGAESDRALGEAHQYAPDPAGQLELEGWARDQVAQHGPDRWARAMFETDTHEHMHLTANTGLPSFHVTPIPDLLLRERIEDASPASLRRFNVKWSIAAGRSPSIGDPDTERRFGMFHVREVPGWDGKFARVERGTGDVRVVRLDDRVVEIDVTAPGPVLVALGTGFYPRWRARHASGVEVPIYALPAIEGGRLHVLSAWVAPGRTVFTCDGALPSDGKGRVLALAAAALALAGLIAWRRPRWRIAVLRRLAALRALVRGHGRTAIEVGVLGLVLGLLGYGIAAARTTRHAVLVGSSGIRPIATVEARIAGGSWETCGFSPWTGVYQCDGLVAVRDATVNVLNDAPPSWAFITPAIAATAEDAGVEVRITRELRLAGRYWIAANPGSARLVLDGSFAHEFTSRRSHLDVPAGDHTLVLEAAVPDRGTLHLTLVHERSLVPTRTFLVEPPIAAPAGVAAIGR